MLTFSSFNQRLRMLPSPAPDVCWLYLIRHGATEHNLQRPPILQGRAVDLYLSAEGVRQAEAVANLLSKAQLTAVFCSTLKRAQQTAEIIAGPHRLPVTAFAQLAE